jgi:hypothetical protein
MKFAFDTDEVFRDTLNKMIAVYEKFFIEDYVYEEGEEEFKYEIIKPITSYNFSDHFKFPSEGEYINFMYMDFPMNICGHAPSISANTFNILSTIQKTTLKKKDRISIIAKAIAKQKPATLFFLSKYGTEVDEVVFYNKKNLKKMWSKFDVIVTANPDLLECKPKNKISIKVESSYNTDSVSDYTINNLEGFTSIYNQL